MVAFVIFWAAVLTMFFFVLSIIFKALASAFNAFLYSMGEILAIGFLATMAIIVLYLVYEIVDGVVTNGIGETIGTIIYFIVVICVILAFIGGLGSIILSIAGIALEYALIAIAFILEGASDICEKGYAKFFMVIVKQIDKC